MSASEINALPNGIKLQSRYVLERKLGAGGFGITYQAYDILNKIECAVKEYAPRGLVVRDDDGITMRTTESRYDRDFRIGKMGFLEEAKMLQRMNYIPEVVCITDYFFGNETVYFVMEYLDGQDLSHRVRQMGGRIPVDEANRIIYKIGDALSIVHKEAHIFHRDISPGNIILLKDGKIKLIDFGNAKSMGDEHVNDGPIVYKPGFSPPEQYSRTGRQGAFTDVYALASTYYYIVSGRRIPDAMDRMAGESYVKLKNMNLGVNTKISNVIDVALELDEGKRLKTVKELISAFYEKEITVAKNKYPYLEVMQGENKGEIWRIPPNYTVKLGRSSRESNIVADHALAISKLHCEIYYDGVQNQFRITDYSTNGTFLNGIRIGRNQMQIAYPGQMFQMGKNICTIKVGVIYE